MRVTVIGKSSSLLMKACVILDIDDPIVVNKSGGGGAEPPAAQVSMLIEMGFTSAQAKKALRETVCSSFTLPLSFPVRLTKPF